MSRNVLVLAGGLSYEREVSLRSGRRVADALRRSGVDATIRDVDAGLLTALETERPDAVFIALHGASGEDGALRGVLDLLGIPYVGAGSDASRVAWDKAAAKAQLRAVGLPTPDWIALPHETFRELGAQTLLDRIVERLGMPLMVKPASGGSGLGAQAVRTVEELPSAMVACFGYCDTALIERFASGADIAVSIIESAMGPQPLPAVEIVPADGIYDYTARYTAGTTTWHAPARLDPETAERVAETAVAAHDALELRDLSRVDLLVDESGGIQVLEVNVSPGLTETSLLPIAVQAAGLDFGTVLAELVEQAIKRV
ncbi:D-alanine--D-alanine ligase [Cryptosporangium sp. NPDC051539]|uniref:D-alanine--D-alanine ligase n=1 Tax=Cryptosporangium sp. NPDC051539 TaxID=3363962 RepID=UPI0037A4EB83